MLAKIKEYAEKGIIHFRLAQIKGVQKSAIVHLKPQHDKLYEKQTCSGKHGSEKQRKRQGAGRVVEEILNEWLIIKSSLEIIVSEQMLKKGALSLVNK